MYGIQLGPVIYNGWRDGRPFTLADCWHECHGVGAARIVRFTGAGVVTVLDRAGESVGRRERVRAKYRNR